MQSDILRDKLANLYPEIDKKISKEEQQIQEEKEKQYKKEQIERKKENQKIIDENNKVKAWVEKYIDPMYQNNKNLLYHLVVAFTPFTEIRSYLLIHKEVKNPECCFCKTELLLPMDFLDKSSEVFLEKMKINLSKDSEEIKESKLKEISKDLKTGWASDKTDKIICGDCIDNFIHWISNRILVEDSFVTSAIKKSIQNQNEL